jgi:hypothetical protein
MSAEELSAIARLSDRYASAGQKIPLLEEQFKQEEELLKTASEAARPRLEAKQKQRREAIDAQIKLRDEPFLTAQPGLRAPLNSLLMERLQAIETDPLFYTNNASACGPLAPAMEAHRQRLLAYGVISELPGQPFIVNPLLPGTAPVPERLGRYQRALLTRFNAELLVSMLPGLKYESRPNFVDFRLAIPRHWRDVFHYDAAGHLTGFTRYDGQKATELSPNGEIVVSRDALGRAEVVRSVTYQRLTPASYNPRSGPDSTPMTFIPGDRLIHYAYDGDADFKGHVQTGETPSSTTRPAAAVD